MLKHGTERGWEVVAESLHRNKQQFDSKTKNSRTIHTPKLGKTLMFGHNEITGNIISFHKQLENNKIYEKTASRSWLTGSIGTERKQVKRALCSLHLSAWSHSLDPGLGRGNQAKHVVVLS